jgi:hypothetical protein
MEQHVRLAAGRVRLDADLAVPATARAWCCSPTGAAAAG